MTRRLLTASAAAALVLGLAACGDDTGGTITDPPSTIATGTSDDGGASDGGGTGASDGGGSTEAAPDIPAPDPADYPGMDEHTDEGAEQAFKYYFDTAFWGFQTGDVATLNSMTSDSCESCLDLIADIKENDKNGNYWSKVSIEEQTLSSKPSEKFEIDVTYGVTLGEHTEPDPETGEDAATPVSAVAMSGGLSWSDGGWQIGDMALQSEEL